MSAPSKEKLEEMKNRAKLLMQKMQQNTDVSSELGVISNKEMLSNTTQQSKPIDKQLPTSNSKAILDDSFHDMFDQPSTLYPDKTKQVTGQVDKATGLINDGGAAANKTLDEFRRKQAIKAALGKGTMVTATALEAINTCTQPFEVPDNIKDIEGLNAELFMANLLSVEDGVKNSGENIQDYLRLIHANLTQYPELCHLLTDAQIKIIVSGFLTESATQIKVATARGGKSMAKITQGRSKTDLLGLLDLPAL